MIQHELSSQAEERRREEEREGEEALARENTARALKAREEVRTRVS